MRFFSRKTLAFILTLTLGAAVNTELRTKRSGITDCACMSFKCRIMMAADHPKLFFTHPIEIIEDVFSATHYD